MITPLQVLRRLRALIFSRSLDRDTQEELRLHLELETAEGVRGGLQPDEAGRQARMALGGALSIRDEAREARGTAPLLDLGADFRYAVRVLWRSPVFSAVAILTLGLGIGATTAIFSAVHGILLRDLPYPRPGDLVSLWAGGHSRAEFMLVRDRNQTLESVGAYRQAAYPVSMNAGGEPERITSALVSTGFFSTLGIAPRHGRFFQAGEDARGAATAAVLSDALWRRRFGADSAIIGRSIELDGLARQVVGIAPPGFSFPGRTDAWTPMTIDPAQPGPFWGAYGFGIIGRLKPGVSREQARADAARIAAMARQENPVWRPGPEYLAGIEVRPLRESLVGDSRRLLSVLLAAVGMVLLIACANVANLTIVRGTARERELAVRATLGAGRPRLVRQLLAESLLLAGVAGLLGITVALAGTPLLARLLPSSTPRLAEVSVDGAVLLFSAAVTLGAGLLFGVLPALRLARTDLAPSIAGGSATSSIPQRRLAGALVGGQIALAVILATGAGLLFRSLGALLAVDPGFSTVHVVSAQLTPPRLQYGAAERQQLLAGGVLEQLAASPDLEAAAITSQLPFDQTNHVMAMWVDGWTTDPNRLDMFEVRRVSPAFFEVMGIALRRGRVFGAGDGTAGAPVAIVNEAAARRFWQERDVIGGRLRFPWPGWMDVIGVVADVKNNDLAADVSPTIYVPFAQNPAPEIMVVARARGASAAGLAAIRAGVLAAAPDVPVGEEHAMEQLIARSVAWPRSASVLLSLFGALALILGAIGIYGLVAYGVERRLREIAVRMAVGASGADVLRLILRGGLRLALAGIAVGLVAALGLTRLLKGLLYGVEPSDPVAFLVAPALLGLTALLACLVPAWRATRVDPVSILRRD